MRITASAVLLAALALPACGPGSTPQFPPPPPERAMAEALLAAEVQAEVSQSQTVVRSALMDFEEAGDYGIEPCIDAVSYAASVVGDTATLAEESGDPECARALSAVAGDGERAAARAGRSLETDEGAGPMVEADLRAAIDAMAQALDDAWNRGAARFEAARGAAPDADRPWLACVGAAVRAQAAWAAFSMDSYAQARRLLLEVERSLDAGYDDLADGYVQKQSAGSSVGGYDDGPGGYADAAAGYDDTAGGYYGDYPGYGDYGTEEEREAAALMSDGGAAADRSDQWYGLIFFEGHHLPREGTIFEEIAMGVPIEVHDLDRAASDACRGVSAPETAP